MKTIFDLDDKELKKITLECCRTPYYKRYLGVFALSLCTIPILIIIVTIMNGLNYLTDTYELFAYLIGFLLIIIFSILFELKKLDLVKKYYEEKAKK